MCSGTPLAAAGALVSNEQGVAGTQAGGVKRIGAVRCRQRWSVEIHSRSEFCTPGGGGVHTQPALLCVSVLSVGLRVDGGSPGGGVRKGEGGEVPEVGGRGRGGKGEKRGGEGRKAGNEGEVERSKVAGVGRGCAFWIGLSLDHFPGP